MAKPVSRPLYLLSRLVAWTTIPIFLVTMPVSYWLNAQQGVDPIPGTFVIITLLGFASFAVVGSLLVARRPGNLVSWIMVAVALYGSLATALEMYAARLLASGAEPNGLAYLGGWLAGWYGYALVALIIIFLPLFFPTGRLVSRRWRWAPLIVVIGLGGFIALSLFAETFTLLVGGHTIANPLGRPGMPPADQHPLYTVLLGMILTGLLGSLLSVFVRYMRSGDLERRQLRWFLFVLAFFPISFVMGDTLGDVLVAAVIIALPAAVGIAILRYRLYDIDIIIRKTLQYGLLSALLALVYFGSVILLQAAVGPAMEDSPLLIVFSTLLIAALFGALRVRVQRFIDRRFYRSRYDAAQTLAQFAQHARDEVELEALSAELVRVVEETMQPTVAFLWLRRDEQSR